MKVSRAVAVALLSGVGLKNANKLSPEKLTAKLASLPDIAEEGQEFEDPKLKKVFGKVMAAIAAGEALEVQGEPETAEAETAEAEAAEAEEAPAKKAPAKAAPKKKAAQTTDKPGGSGVKKAKKKAPAKEPKEPKGLAGVRESRTRAYLAGILLKVHGTDKGITQELVDALDKASGKPNEVESKFTLRYVWHGIRGFTTKGNEGDLELPAEEE